MLTSAKIGKQNGDTRTRKPEPGYLNLSNMSTKAQKHIFIAPEAHFYLGKHMTLSS
jgi:hypothetical protein